MRKLNFNEVTLPRVKNLNQTLTPVPLPHTILFCGINIGVGEMRALIRKELGILSEK